MFRSIHSRTLASSCGVPSGRWQPPAASAGPGGESNALGSVRGRRRGLLHRMQLARRFRPATSTVVNDRPRALARTVRQTFIRAARRRARDRLPQRGPSLKTFLAPVSPMSVGAASREGWFSVGETTVVQVRAVSRSATSHAAGEIALSTPLSCQVGHRGERVQACGYTGEFDDRVAGAWCPCKDVLEPESGVKTTGGATVRHRFQGGGHRAGREANPLPCVRGAGGRLPSAARRAGRERLT